MAKPEISDIIKKNIRSVLLSKYDGKGILVSEFLNEYKKLMKEPLHLKSMGFETIQKFIEAMPDVIRLDYSKECMGFKMFAVQNPNSYMSLSAKKALGRNGNVNSPKQGTGRERREGAQINGHDVSCFQRGRKGLFSLCFPNKPTNGLNTPEAISAKFSAAGTVADVNIIELYTFVRFKEEAEAAKAMKLFEKELGLKLADEKDNGKHKVNEDSRLKQVEDRLKGKCDIHSLKGKNDLIISPKEESSKSCHEVYVGNISFDCSQTELEKLFAPFQCKELRVKRSSNKVYAFASFLDFECAKTCCEKMNGFLCKGRNLNVRFVQKPKELKGYSSDSAKEVVGGRNATDALTMVSLNNDTKHGITDKMANLTMHTEQRGKQGVIMSNDEDMPPLEHILDDTDDMPELELTETKQTPSRHEAKENGVRMLIGNFPYGTYESELMLLFKKFGAEEIVIMNTTTTNRSTYAFTRVADLTQANLAITELDQSIFHGRRLMVGIADKTYQEKPSTKPGLLPIPNIPLMSLLPHAQIPAYTFNFQSFPQHMETMGSMPGKHNFPLNSPGRFSTPDSMGTAPKQGDQKMIIGCFNPGSWDEILHTYMVVVGKLRANSRDHIFPQFSQLHVQITSVYDNGHFWAHVLQDNEPFERMMAELQVNHSQLAETSKLGRCAAVYESKFYRGWIMGSKEDMVTVFYVDYGNVETIRRAQTSTTTSLIWSLPPLAKPFKLSKPIPDLKNRLESHLVKLEIIQSGTESTGYTSEVRIVEVF